MGAMTRIVSVAPLLPNGSTCFARQPMSKSRVPLKTESVTFANLRLPGRRAQRLMHVAHTPRHFDLDLI